VPQNPRSGLLLIPLPERATVDDSFELIPLLAEAENVQGDVILDASKTTVFGPFGVGVIASTMALRRTRGYQTSFVGPRNVPAQVFLDEIGFFRAVAGEQPRPGTLEMRQLHALDAMYTDGVVQLLVANVPGINEDNGYAIQLCLNELLQNVFEWGESRVGCFVLARWYRNTRSARLAVVEGDTVSPQSSAAPRSGVCNVAPIRK
jgi:hypothetical protein